MSKPDAAMVVWFTGALDEIERVARACAVSATTESVWVADGAVVEGDDNMIIYDEGGHGPEQASHIALHDPRAVLARVQAERMVLASVNAIPASEEIVQELAYGHRFDAPGWRKEWAPGGVGVQ